MTTVRALLRPPRFRWAARSSVRPRPVVVFGALAVLLLGIVLANFGAGAVEVGPLQVTAILLRRLGLSVDVSYTAQQDAVVWAIRAPRVVLVLLVGSGLGIAGATLQGLFRNPLADPGLIGVSSGAALGAVAAVLLGFSLFGVFALPVAAFTGGLAVTMAVYLVARSGGRVEIVTLILTGIAMNALAGAGVGLGTFLADDRQLRTIVFWSLGSAGGATWATVRALLPFVAAGLLILPWFGRSLNLLVLGEREARRLGVDTERLRLTLIGLAALVTGASVAVAGIIGFVGLVTPHLLRLLLGPDHRTLLPASAFGGAILLLTADLIARTAVAPRELPLGVVTALAGGPFFLWLVMRTRHAQGGWG